MPTTQRTQGKLVADATKLYINTDTASGPIQLAFGEIDSSEIGGQALDNAKRMALTWNNHDRLVKALKREHGQEKNKECDTCMLLSELDKE